jgi:hypothetical protein
LLRYNFSIGRLKNKLPRRNFSFGQRDPPNAAPHFSFDRHDPPIAVFLMLRPFAAIAPRPASFLLCLWCDKRQSQLIWAI